MKILNYYLKLINQLKFNLKKNKKKILFNCDKEQIGRVFFNLIKNSIESIQQKSEKNPKF